MSLHLFAGLRVQEFDTARTWYERLLGEPSFFPHATEAVWTLGDGRSLYVIEDADRAGQCVVTLFVDDLDARLAEIAARGLDPDDVETYPNGVRKAVYRDPDGNEIGFAGRSASSGNVLDRAGARHLHGHGSRSTPAEPPPTRRARRRRPSSLSCTSRASSTGR